ncbi:MAG: hypothetical protein ABIH83_05435 [Candidatus Micrarchaeota archaeon]
MGVKTYFAFADLLEKWSIGGARVDDFVYKRGSDLPKGHESRAEKQIYTHPVFLRVKDGRKLSSDEPENIERDFINITNADFDVKKVFRLTRAHSGIAEVFGCKHKLDIGMALAFFDKKGKEYEYIKNLGMLKLVERYIHSPAPEKEAFRELYTLLDEIEKDNRRKKELRLYAIIGSKNGGTSLIHNISSLASQTNVERDKLNFLITLRKKIASSRFPRNMKAITTNDLSINISKN